MSTRILCTALRHGCVAATLLGSVLTFSSAPANETQGVRVTAANETRNFASVVDAFNYIRTARAAGLRGNVRVMISAGVWKVAQPIVIDDSLAGANHGGIEVVGAGAGKTVLSGAVAGDVVPNANAGAGVQTITLPAPVSLKPYDILHDYDALAAQIFQGDRMFRLSRWPRAGFATGRLRADGDAYVLTLDDTAGPDWSKDTALWLSGYFRADYAYAFFKGKPAPDGRSIISQRFFNNLDVRSKVRFRVENSSAGFSDDGTYLIDADGQTVHVRAYPGAGEVEIGKATLLLRIENARHVRISGLSVIKSLGDGILIRNGQDVRLSDVSVTQVGHTGILVQGGSSVSLDRITVRDAGGGGVILEGGDRPSLTAANHIVAHSLIERFALVGRDYHPGILLRGVGLRAEQNVIRSGNAQGIFIVGNENTASGNEISELLGDSDDAGAIYLGFDWTQRGNRIVDNFIHDIAYGRGKSFVSGIYLDDQISGATVERNVLWNVPIGVVLGGGRDNIICDNWVVNAERGAINLDERGKDPKFDPAQARLRKLFVSMPVNSPIWRAHYPQLPRLLSEDPSAARSNDVSRNRAVNGKIWTATSPSSLMSPNDNRSISILGLELERIRSRMAKRNPSGMPNWSKAFKR